MTNEIILQLNFFEYLFNNLDRDFRILNLI